MATENPDSQTESQTNSESAKAQLLEAIQQTFPAAEPEAILEVLNLYGQAPHEREQQRVYLAMLKVSQGDLDKLNAALKLAKEDYRDILMQAEYPPLTPRTAARELETLALIARGASNKVIARELDIAETTVKIHVQHILRKLNLSSRVQAAVYAASHGIG